MNIAVTPEPHDRAARASRRPPPPRRWRACRLHPVMMRDILLKTMFRMNVTHG